MTFPCQPRGLRSSFVTFLDPVTLTGRLVRLEPLTTDHTDALAAAASDGDVGGLWYTSAPTPDAVADDIAAKLAAARRRAMLPFATRRLADDRIIGVTTYLNPLPDVPAVEIGATWNAASARRTGTNTDSKLLLLRHAVEEWGCRRVAFRATWFNHESRRAIERLGAVFEGRIRNDRVTRDGIVTDTAQYAITDDAWPAVERHLTHLLDSHLLDTHLLDTHGDPR